MADKLVGVLNTSLVMDASYEGIKNKYIEVIIDNETYTIEAKVLPQLLEDINNSIEALQKKDYVDFSTSDHKILASKISQLPIIKVDGLRTELNLIQSVLNRSFNKATLIDGIFKLTRENGQVVSIELPEDKFINDIKYYPNLNNLVFNSSDNTSLIVNLNDLLLKVNADNTTLERKVDGNGNIIFSVKPELFAEKFVVDNLITVVNNTNESIQDHSDILANVLSEIAEIKTDVEGTNRIRVFENNEELDAWAANPDNIATLNKGDLLKTIHRSYSRDFIYEKYWDGEKLVEFSLRSFIENDLPFKFYSVGDLRRPKIDGELVNRGFDLLINREDQGHYVFNDSTTYNYELHLYVYHFSRGGNQYALQIFKGAHPDSLGDITPTVPGHLFRKDTTYFRWYNHNNTEWGVWELFTDHPIKVGYGLDYDDSFEFAFAKSGETDNKLPGGWGSTLRLSDEVQNLLNQVENIAEGANNYTLPKASQTTLGGIKLGGSNLVMEEDGTLYAYGITTRIEDCTAGTGIEITEDNVVNITKQPITKMLEMPDGVEVYEEAFLKHEGKVYFWAKRDNPTKALEVGDNLRGKTIIFDKQVIESLTDVAYTSLIRFTNDAYIMVGGDPLSITFNTETSDIIKIKEGATWHYESYTFPDTTDYIVESLATDYSEDFNKLLSAITLQLPEYGWEELVPRSEVDKLKTEIELIKQRLDNNNIE